MRGKEEHTLVGTLAELLVAGRLLDKVEDGLGQFVGGEGVGLGVDIGGRLQADERLQGTWRADRPWCAIKRTVAF